MLKRRLASQEARDQHRADVALAEQFDELFAQAQAAEQALRDAQANGAAEKEQYRAAKRLDSALTDVMRAAFAAQRAAIGPRGYDERIYRRKALATPKVRAWTMEAERLLTLRESHRLTGIPRLPRRPVRLPEKRTTPPKKTTTATTEETSRASRWLLPPEGHVPTLDATTCTYQSEDNGSHCPGRRVDGFKHCLAHLTRKQLDQVLQSLRSGDDLNASGTPISAELLTRILQTLNATNQRRQFRHVSFANANFLAGVSFEGAQFDADVSFEGAQFDADVSFEDAQFAGSASFDRAEFAGPASFKGAKLAGAASLNDAQFAGDVSFEEVQFTRDASFKGAKFTGAASLNDAQFAGDAMFEGAKFTGTASFNGAQFTGTASFKGVELAGGALFNDAQFAGDVSFEGAKFTEAASFEGAKFTGAALLEGAKFAGAVSFDRAEFTGAASFEGAKFAGGALFNDAQFAGAASFEGVQFARAVSFYRAKFDGAASFKGAELTGGALLNDAQFAGAASFEGVQFTETASFKGAKFTGDALLNDAQFAGDAWFRNAQFARAARFRNAQFARAASFDGAQFTGAASFDNAEFAGDASFKDAKFARTVWFHSAQFTGAAAFDGAQFTEGAMFDRAQFTGPASVAASFNGAEFAGPAFFGRTQFTAASFDGAQFTELAAFDRAQFSELAWFGRAEFRKATSLGPLSAGILRLNGAVFDSPLVIEAASKTVSCTNTKWNGGVTLRLRGAAVGLERANFAEPSFVTGSDKGFKFDEDPPDDKEARKLARNQDAESPEPWMPGVETLRGTDTSRLSVTDVDLSRCRFAGALLLDQLRLEGRCVFDHPPTGIQIGWAWPPVWWWSSRQSLAEERDWRATTRKRAGWTVARSADSAEDAQSADNAEDAQSADSEVGPERLAGLYRQLRKAQEDAKNEPGAADFYYGEMEMRRHAHSTPAAERAIVWLYWLISGYGLRATRSMTALVAFGIIVTAALTGWGLAATAPVTIAPQHLSGTITAPLNKPARINATLHEIALGLPPATQRWTGERTRTALEVTFESFAFRSTDQPLTDAGTWITIAARILGPVLLALTLLAVRNRVKR
jgi:hypothetical protein